jgi:hypothetical protein
MYDYMCNYMQLYMILHDGLHEFYMFTKERSPLRARLQPPSPAPPPPRPTRALVPPTKPLLGWAAVWPGIHPARWAVRALVGVGVGGFCQRGEGARTRECTALEVFNSTGLCQEGG